MVPVYRTSTKTFRYIKFILIEDYFDVVEFLLIEFRLYVLQLCCFEFRSLDGIIIYFALPALRRDSMGVVVALIANKSFAWRDPWLVLGIILSLLAKGKRLRVSASTMLVPTDTSNVLYVWSKLFKYESPSHYSLRFTQSCSIDQILMVGENVNWVSKQNSSELFETLCDWEKFLLHCSIIQLHFWQSTTEECYWFIILTDNRA